MNILPPSPPLSPHSHHLLYWKYGQWHVAWNNSRFKRIRSNFQCLRFMHQKCLGPKTCFMRVKMEDIVPLPQVANRPYVCEIYLCTGIPGTRQASEIGGISPGWQPCLSPATVTILTCSCRGNSSVTECRKRYRQKGAKLYTFIT